MFVIFRNLTLFSYVLLKASSIFIVLSFLRDCESSQTLQTLLVVLIAEQSLSLEILKYFEFDSCRLPTLYKVLIFLSLSHFLNNIYSKKLSYELHLH